MSSPDDAGTPDDADKHLLRVEWPDVDDPCLEIVRAVAAVTGRDALELPPLNDAVDGDALETLARQAPTADVRISFTYAATTVVVDCGVAIEVRAVDA